MRSRFVDIFMGIKEEIEREREREREKEESKIETDRATVPPDF